MPVCDTLADGQMVPARMNTTAVEDEVESDDEEEEEVHCDVDYLVGKRGSVAKGTRQFLVKWTGYSESENSWVPEEDVSPYVVEEFLEYERKGLMVPARAAAVEAAAATAAAAAAAAAAAFAAQEAAERTAAKAATAARAKVVEEVKTKAKEHSVTKPKASAARPTKGRSILTEDTSTLTKRAATDNVLSNAKVQRQEKRAKVVSSPVPPWPRPVLLKWSAFTRMRWWIYNSLNEGMPAPDAQLAGADDSCSVCLQGGALLCCDSCPRSFHRKCLESIAMENGAKPSNVTPNKSSVDEPWACVHCVELSHAQACVVSGHYGSDGGHLVPCVSCPRAFHPLVIADLAAGAAVEGLVPPITCGDDGKWRCRWCASSGAATGSLKASDGDSLPTQREMLRRAACDLSKLPKWHWGSVVGSRIEACVDMEQVVADAGASSNGVRNTRNGIVETQRRLFYCCQTEPEGGEGDMSGAKSNHARGKHVVKDALTCPEIGTCATEPRALLLATTVRDFLRNGFCAPTDPRWSVSQSVAEAARDAVLTRFNDTIFTVGQLDLYDDLAIGFRTFKKRGEKRYDFMVSELDDMHELGDDAPWLPLVRATLGDDVKRLSVSCILSLPGSDMQAWHSDGAHLSEALHLPPHCLNVFVPLCEMSTELGPTEFVPGSHIHYDTDAKAEAPVRSWGQPILFDHRVRHRGVPNRSNVPRALLYVTYAKSWFEEVNNIGLRDSSKENYRDLPPLLHAPSSRRSGDKRDALNKKARSPQQQPSRR